LRAAALLCPPRSPPSWSLFCPAWLTKRGLVVASWLGVFLIWSMSPVSTEMTVHWASCSSWLVGVTSGALAAWGVLAAGVETSSTARWFRPRRALPRDERWAAGGSGTPSTCLCDIG